jgi:tryptophan synthase beta chain
MHTLGHESVPPPIYAGGLRYHGVAPSISLLYEAGWIEIKEYEQKECFEAGRLFAKAEGIVPAPETNHAIRAVIDLALEAKKKNEEMVILFNFSGHGLLDLSNYEKTLGL